MGNSRDLADVGAGIADALDTIVMEGATGGSQGAGTINCKGVYKDGVEVTGGAGSLTTYINELTLANNGTDSDHDIDISTGDCYSEDDVLMTLSSALTKQVDATWAAGNNAGGLFNAAGSPATTVQVSTWYHIFLIRKDSDGTIDAGFDTSVTAANIPSGYTSYRRIGAVYTDGSANITAFQMNAFRDRRIFMWDTPVTSIDTTTSTTATSYTMRVPTNLKVVARLSGLLYDNATGVNSAFRVYDPNQADITVTRTKSQLYTRGNPYGESNSEMHVVTNTSGQVRARGSATSSNSNIEVKTLGWEE